MRALGAVGFEFDHFRLTYEDLDDDGNPEALFALENVSMAIERLVVFKRKGAQWYRLASPPGFECRCKYENPDFDTFAQVRSWRFSEKDGPSKLLFVRENGGGTGGYYRHLHVYALRGFFVDEAFSVTEEQRDCDPSNDQCDLHHEEVNIERTNEPLALLAVSYERHTVSGESFRDSTWWVGSPVRQCKAYTWSPQRRKFLENAAVTTEYCSNLGSQSPARAPR
jgi:hypothetical protein